MICQKHNIEKKHVLINVWVCPKCIEDKVRKLERKNKKEKERKRKEDAELWDLHLFQMH